MPRLWKQALLWFAAIVAPVCLGDTPTSLGVNDAFLRWLLPIAGKACHGQVAQHSVDLAAGAARRIAQLIRASDFEALDRFVLNEHLIPMLGGNTIAPTIKFTGAEIDEIERASSPIAWRTVWNVILKRIFKTISPSFLHFTTQHRDPLAPYYAAFGFHSLAKTNYFFVAMPGPLQFERPPSKEALALFQRVINIIRWEEIYHFADELHHQLTGEPLSPVVRVYWHYRTPILPMERYLWNATRSYDSVYRELAIAITGRYEEGLFPDDVEWELALERHPVRAQLTDFHEVLTLIAQDVRLGRTVSESQIYEWLRAKAAEHVTGF